MALIALDADTNRKITHRWIHIYTRTRPANCFRGIHHALSSVSFCNNSMCAGGQVRVRVRIVRNVEITVYFGAHLQCHLYPPKYIHPKDTSSDTPTNHTGCRMPLTLFNTRSATPNASAFRTHKTGACKARDPHPQATTHMTERANAKNNRASARARTHAGTHPHAHTRPHERWRDGALSVRHKAFCQARAARGLVRWKRVRRPRCTRRL